VAETARELGITHNVDVLGYVSGPDLARCYREADALVLPTYFAEGFPTVFLEAMSMGLPIVTTKLRGAADWLDEGVNTLFVPPQRPDVLAAAIDRVLADDRLRASMAGNNLTKVREFSPENVAPRYMTILESVVEKDAARSATAEG
jgi:glycosyltransferase involved in cell wall biosynthesis